MDIYVFYPFVTESSSYSYSYYYLTQLTEANLSIDLIWWLRVGKLKENGGEFLILFPFKQHRNCSESKRVIFGSKALLAKRLKVNVSQIMTAESRKPSNLLRIYPEAT